MLLYGDGADLATCQGNSHLKYFAQTSFMRSILNSVTHSLLFIYWAFIMYPMSPWSTDRNIKHIGWVYKFMGLQNTVMDKVTMRITEVKSSGQGEK